MGPKKRQRTGDTTLDMDNHLNWSKVKLRHELSLVGLVTSPTFTLSTLRNLYVDNVLNRSRNNFSSQTTNSVPMLRRQSRIPRPTNSTGPTSDTIRVDTVQSRLTANISPEESTVRDYNNVPYVTVRDDHEQRGDSVSARNDITDNTTSGSSGPGNNMAANITSPTVIQALVDTMTGMQAVMTKLINNEDKQKSLPTLADVYSARHDSFASREQQTRRSYGVSPEDIPHMDLMAPSLRRQIIEGRDVNLATLLIPYYELHEHSDKHRNDIRLRKTLTIGEFITAFGRYKRTMCQVYPDRREELDQYEAIIVNLFNTYGSKFYEYHKLFSLKSANAMQLHGMKLDWSIRDRDLIQMVTAGSKSRSCSICNESTHDTHFCPRFVANDKSQQDGARTHNSNRSTDVDKHGRKRMFNNGVEICNNFNSNNGCRRESCPYSHVCSQCKDLSHKLGECKDHNLSQSKKKN